MLIRHFYLNQTLAQAMYAPRFHHQLMPMIVNYESALDPIIQSELRKKGHRLTTDTYPGGFGSITAISRDEQGQVLAMNDPRRVGSVEVFDVE